MGCVCVCGCVCGWLGLCVAGGELCLCVCCWLGLCACSRLKLCACDLG